MKRTLSLIPVLVLLVAFTVGIAATVSADPPGPYQRECWYEMLPGDDCLSKCCYYGPNIKCTLTRICIH